MWGLKVLERLVGFPASQDRLSRTREGCRIQPQSTEGPVSSMPCHPEDPAEIKAETQSWGVGRISAGFVGGRRILPRLLPEVKPL